MRLTIAASGSVTPADLEPEVLDDLVELFHRYRESPDDT
jgi:hypothetical protein